MNMKSPPGITVFDVADWFLARAKAEGKPLKHMKLQKLVYFAHGWYCAYREYSEPLFADSILVWRRGVLVKDLYEKYKSFGENPIDIEGLQSPDLHVSVTEILEAVWKAYSHLSNSILDMAIERHSAWREAQCSSEWDAVMSLESIQNTFKEMIALYEHA